MCQGHAYLKYVFGLFSNNYIVYDFVNKFNHIYFSSIVNRAHINHSWVCFLELTSTGVMRNHGREPCGVRIHDPEIARQTAYPLGHHSPHDFANKDFLSKRKERTATIYQKYNISIEKNLLTFFSVKQGLSNRFHLKDPWKRNRRKYTLPLSKSWLYIVFTLLCTHVS